MEDLENGTVAVAVRLEPRFYVGKKAAGYTFLGKGSVGLPGECLGQGLIETRPDARLIPRSYYSVWAAVYRAKRKAGLDPKIQSCHGFRKYFENALDEAGIDHERKMVIEGHFAGTRAKHYTDRDLEELRELYGKAYPFIALAPDDSSYAGASAQDWYRRLIELESKLDRQSILEARLTALEGELGQLGKSRQRVHWTDSTLSAN